MKTLYEELREERKKLQDQGKLPAWMTTNGYQLFKEKYLWDCSNFKEQAKRIAKVAASHTDDPKHWAKKFYTVIWNGWLACSTPVLANMGTTRGCPVSCSGGTVTDSVQGFYEARLEAAILTKNGFGTSAYLGDIRPRGTAISTGGVGSGILPELKAFIQVSRDVTQGGVRRGAWAGYIDIDHGDFWEIATYMVNFPDDLNIGWNISTEFINRLQSSDPEAISRYQRALKVKCTTGKGYFWFVDKVNALRPECYKHYNRVNKASNLCFTGDTLVAVADGYGVARIDKLALESAGEVKFPVYSSRFDTVKKKWIQEVKSAVAFKTGTERVITLTLSDRSTLKCTPSHLLAVSDGGYVRAMDSIGESLVPYVDPEGGVTEVEPIEVVSTFDMGEVQDVYDLTVQDNHNFNIITGYGFDNISRHAGILVHNCTEISLSSDEEHTFSCVLSSVNLSKYDEWKDTDTIFVSTVFLDCVAQEFIQIGKKIPSLEKIVRYTEKSRALGLGTLGFHTYLQQKSIPMESLEAHMENNTIFKDLHDKSLEASQWMAKEWGEPEWCKGFSIRNTHRCVKGDTVLQTKTGIRKIEDTVGQKIEVWNGFQFSEVTPFIAGEGEDLYEVHLSNGRSLSCTSDHKWKVLVPERSNAIRGSYKSLSIETSGLRIGDCLPKTLGCLIIGEDLPHLPHAYTSGVFCGDGSINCSKAGKYPRNEIRLYDKKVEIRDRLDWKSKKPWDAKINGEVRGIRGYLVDDLLPKYEVPINYSLESRLEWLAGLIDTDGSSARDGLALSTSNKKMAEDILTLLSTLGCFGNIVPTIREEGNPCYVIFLTSLEVASLKKLGMKLSRVQYPPEAKSNSMEKLSGAHFVKIVSIEKLEGTHKTYCLTDPIEGTCTFNGVYTEQCSIAPNMSSSLICGGVSQGIEPVMANVFQQGSAGGEMNRINPVLLELMKAKGVYTEEAINAIGFNKGSVQDVEWLTPHEKAVFKTAFEIDQRVLLRLASTRQKFICQAQSLNLFFSAEEEEAYISEIHKEAFLDPNIKALYYLRSSSGIQASKGDCEACEG